MAQPCLHRRGQGAKLLAASQFCRKAEVCGLTQPNCGLGNHGQLPTKSNYLLGARVHKAGIYQSDGSENLFEPPSGRSRKPTNGDASLRRGNADTIITRPGRGGGSAARRCGGAGLRAAATLLLADCFFFFFLGGPEGGGFFPPGGGAGVWTRSETRQLLQRHSTEVNF